MRELHPPHASVVWYLIGRIEWDAVPWKPGIAVSFKDVYKKLESLFWCLSVSLSVTERSGDSGIIRMTSFNLARASPLVLNWGGLATTVSFITKSMPIDFASANLACRQKTDWLCQTNAKSTKTADKVDGLTDSMWSFIIFIVLDESNLVQSKLSSTRQKWMCSTVWQFNDNSMRIPIPFLVHQGLTRSDYSLSVCLITELIN